MNVFVIDPGYSLRNAYYEWKENNFPGQALYGVQYFKENGITPIFQKNEIPVLESSKGASCKDILLSRLKYEFNVIKEYNKNKMDIDAVYIPVMGFGALFLLLRKMGFIRKPVIGIAHSVNFDGTAHKIKNKIFFKVCNHIFFLSDKVCKKAKNLFPKQAKDFSNLSLMPDPIKQPENHNQKKKYAFALIGKTYRDYKAISKAAKIAKLPGIIVGGWRQKSTKTNMSLSYVNL